MLKEVWFGRMTHGTFSIGGDETPMVIIHKIEEAIFMDPDDVEEHLENHDSYLIPDDFTGEVVFKGNPKNTAKVLELVQQVYFDVSDFLEREKCTTKIKTFEEFETMEDFMAEQKSRMEEIETRLEQS
jgi:hypothetical protein